MAVAVITGASRGLGAGLAETFSASGHQVATCARTLPSGGALARSVDMTDAGAVERFAAEVAGELGPIDLWINNAGILGPVGPFRDADPAEVAAVLSVNVLGVVHGTQSFLRHRSADGMLVNISSGAATTAREGVGPYCASKAAVEMLTEVVNAEVRAYAVAPGVVDTDVLAELLAVPVERLPWVEQFRELKRIGAYNSPAWVAQHLLDLLSGAVDPPVRWRIPDEPH